MTDAGKDDVTNEMPVVNTLDESSVDIVDSQPETLEETPRFDPEVVFRAATASLFDTMLLSIHLTQVHIFRDGDLQFPQDLEAKTFAVDRHAGHLVLKKEKENGHRSPISPSRGKVMMTGRTSRSHVSREGDRLTNRSSTIYKDGINHTIKRSTIMNGSPLRATEWNDGASEACASSSNLNAVPSVRHIPESNEDVISASANFSLGSVRNNYTRGTGRSMQTTRAAIDPRVFEENKRREEITRVIESREGSERMAERIQRKSHLKLKLRSMTNPMLSFDLEEHGINTTKQQKNSGASAVASPETTFRPDDYEGLDSELVMMDKKGELLVGENCFLVARKPRAEIEHDMIYKSSIEPCIRVSHHEDPSHDNCIEPVQHVPASPNANRRAQKHQSVSKSSPAHATLTSNPLFEGQRGSYQPYPHIELDPENTPLSKGVTIKSNDPPIAASSSTSSINSGAHASKLAEDSPNDILDKQLNDMLKPVGNTEKNKPHQQQEFLPSARSTTALDARPGTRSMHQLPSTMDSKLGQNIRLRTPSYGNHIGSRMYTSGESTSLTTLHEAVSSHGTLQSPIPKVSTSANLPQVLNNQYMREFPTPPKGQIHVISATKASILTNPNYKDTIGFSTLPIVVRNKR